MCVCAFSDSLPLEAVARHWTQSPVRHSRPLSFTGVMYGSVSGVFTFNSMPNGSAFHWTRGGLLGQVNATQVSDVSRTFDQNGLLRPWNGGPGVTRVLASTVTSLSLYLWDLELLCPRWAQGTWALKRWATRTAFSPPSQEGDLLLKLQLGLQSTSRPDPAAAQARQGPLTLADSADGAWWCWGGGRAPPVHALH